LCSSILDAPPSASSILGDDLILCRLSSLLPPADYDNLARSGRTSSSKSSSSGGGDRRGKRGSNNIRPQLVRKVSSSDVSMDEFDSCDDSSDNDDGEGGAPPTSPSSKKRGRRTSSSSSGCDDSSSASSTGAAGGSGGGFSLIPGDVAVVLPPELRHADEVASSPKNSGVGGKKKNMKNASGKNGSSNSSSSNVSIHQSPLQNLLNAVGLEEVEALDPTNGGPSAGQCQFACIASALSRSFGTDQPLRGRYRPDLDLRRLALHAIRMNPDLYRNFLTVAGGRTRKHAQAAGTSVEVDAYLRTMSNPTCDGDAVTLQALCDALKITVRIVKPVTADSYDEDRQNRLLREYYDPPARGDSAESSTSRAAPSSSASMPDASSDEEAYATAVEDDDDDSSTASTSSLATAYSTLSWSDNPYSSCTRIRHVHHIHNSRESSTTNADASSTASVRQRLYVSQEIRPRRLSKIDTRIRDVQKISRGRLIWLSHIGDEAHYRYLRPLSMSSCSTASDSPHGPVNDEEATIARRSREQRRRQLDSLLRSREDGYVRPYMAQNGSGRARSSSMDKAELDIVSRDKLLRLKKVICNEPSQSPRCGLCFQGFFGGGSAAAADATASSDGTTSSSRPPTPPSPTLSLCSPVSPSGCDHDFCRSCIQAWAANVGPTCPTCSSHFMDLIALDGQRVVTARSVTPPIEDDMRGMDISCENSLPSSTSSAGLSKAQKQRVTPLHPPALSVSFTWSRALAPPEKGNESAVSAFNRQMLAEVGHELRLGVPMTATNAVVLIRFMGQLATMVDGPQLRNLLNANILRTLRLLLTPTSSKSTVRSVGVVIPGVTKKRYVPNGEIFRAVLAIIERINVKCSVAGGRSMLTMAMLRDSLDLPKMMLWYVSCPEVKKSEGYTEGLGCARRVLASWSKQHCLSIVQALQKCGSLEAAEKKLEASKKRALVTAASAAAKPTKKPRTATAKTGSRVGNTAGSIAANVATKPKKDPKPPIVRVLPRIPPPAPIQRGEGKRVIRPVVCVNISREEMHLRQYRQE